MLETEEIGLKLPPGLPFERWYEIGGRIEEVLNRIPWVIGDWLVYGEDAYGERSIEKACELFGMKAERLINYAWVARRVAGERRHSKVPWSLHRVVARLPAHDQDSWLTKASTHDWTTLQLQRSMKGAPVEEEKPETEHTRIQWHLLKLGTDMGYDVWVAPDNRHESYDGNAFTEVPGLLDELPPQFGNTRAHEIVKRIDVLWLKGKTVRRAFEIEHTTPVYSGLLRMSDLITLVSHLNIPLHIVAPSSRRDKVMQEINRPTFRASGMPRKCRLIVFEVLFEAIPSLGPASKHLQESYLDEISENCEVIDAG